MMGTLCLLECVFFVKTFINLFQASVYVCVSECVCGVVCLDFICGGFGDLDGQRTQHGQSLIRKLGTEQLVRVINLL